MKKAISIAKYILSLSLAAALLYYAFRNIDFDDFVSKAATVDYTWVILSIVLSLLSYYARAYRWNILLKPLGHNNLNVHRTNLAILVGYLANLAFPRLGEVTRCAWIKKSDEVPVSESLGTVITERIIDLLTLIVLILIALIVEYDRFMALIERSFSGVDEGMYWKAGLVLAVGGLGFMILIYVLYLKVPKVKNFIKELIRGLISLKSINNIGGFVGSTLVLWVTYYLMSYLIVFSLPETAHLDWMVGVMLLVTGGIALVIPVQGGIGTYHALISTMLVLYAVDKTTGVFLATLLHTSQIVAVGIFGGIALLISLIIFNKKRKDDLSQ